MSPNTKKVLKFIIPLIIIFIVWMVVRAAINSGFDEADRMLAQRCYSTSRDWLGVPKTLYVHKKHTKLYNW